MIWCKLWKRSVYLTKCFRELPTPNSLFHCLPVREVRGLLSSSRSTGLEMVWQILDGFHAKVVGEKIDESYENRDSAKRRHGQSMNDRLIHLTRSTSDWVMASKLVRRASLPPKERPQVLLETVLRAMFLSCTSWRQERDKQYHQP